MKRQMTSLRLALMLIAIQAVSAFAAQATAVFPAKGRVNSLFIAPPHGYNGGAAAECALLESLCNVRFTAAQVPHDAGDHMADVDGHFGIRTSSMRSSSSPAARAPKSWPSPASPICGS